MPTLEPDFAQADAITFEASIHGAFTPAQAEWLEAFYRNVESRMLNLYEGARLRASRFQRAEEIAEFWDEQANWFDQMLSHVDQTKKRFSDLQVAAPAALESLIGTLGVIVLAARGAYEFHA